MNCAACSHANSVFCPSTPVDIGSLYPLWMASQRPNSSPHPSLLWVPPLPSSSTSSSVFCPHVFTPSGCWLVIVCLSKVLKCCRQQGYAPIWRLGPAAGVACVFAAFFLFKREVAKHCALVFLVCFRLWVFEECVTRTTVRLLNVLLKLIRNRETCYMNLSERFKGKTCMVDQLSIYPCFLVWILNKRTV